MLLERNICKESMHEEEHPSVHICLMLSCSHGRLMFGAGTLQHAVAESPGRVASVPVTAVASVWM